jgi:hypothetical protein
VQRFDNFFLKKKRIKMVVNPRAMVVPNISPLMAIKETKAKEIRKAA